MFFCEFCKIFKNIFWRDTSGWLLLVFICEFWVFRSPPSTFGKLLISSTSCWISTTRYRKVLHPEYFGTIWTVWAPKKNDFPNMFHVKPKWNIVCKYSKKTFFSRDSNILPQMHWTKDIFGHPATIIRGLGVSLNYPILNFKKTVCPKNVRMQHCRKKVFHKCFSSILYKNKK